MNLQFGDVMTSAAFWIVFKASILIVAAALAQLALRRRASAAIRHSIWMCGLITLFLLPLVSSALPAWPIAVRIAAEPTHLTASPGPIDVSPVEREVVAPSGCAA